MISRLIYLLANLKATVVNGDDIVGGLCDCVVKTRLEEKRTLGIPLDLKHHHFKLRASDKLTIYASGG